MNEWIDVYKRTPKIENTLRSELVFVTIEDTGYNPVVGPVVGYRKPLKPRVDVGYLQEITSGTNVWINQMGNLIEEPPWLVTHWQSLPDPQTLPTSGKNWTVFGYDTGKMVKPPTE